MYTMYVIKELSCFVARSYEVVKNVVQQFSSLYSLSRYNTQAQLLYCTSDN